MGRYGISINVTVRCAGKPPGLPLMLLLLCRAKVFGGCQVRVKSGVTKSQAVSGATFVRCVEVRFPIVCRVLKWFGSQPVCLVDWLHQGFLFISTQNPLHRGNKNLPGAFGWRVALRAWNHLTNCCSTFRACGPPPDAHYAALHERR